MSRPSLVDETADRLLDGIVDGRYQADGPMPTESELAQEMSVSRLTLREAMKRLSDQGIVQIRQGRGTFVNTLESWTGLEALARAQRATVHDDGHVPRQLVEARRVLEVAVSEMAATTRTGDDLERLQTALDEMSAAHRSADVDRFVRADLAFHQTIMAASGNVFIAAMFQPLSDLLLQTRTQTSAVATIRKHALAHHRRILEAIREADPGKARTAMNDHIQQTKDDLERYVLS